MTITVEAEGNHVAGPMVKAFTEDLRQALERYRLENNLTLKELAIQLDSSPGQVSKYLSKKPEGDVVRLEAVIEDVLAGDRRKRTVSHQLFKTPTYKSVASALNTVRETNDIAVIYGHAGIGKTCAISLYCGEHSSVLDITATEDRRGAAAVCALLCGKVSMRSWKRDCPRSMFLASRLRGSNRLVIVDQAHRLSTGGFRWLWDFHDETGCPLGLVGNPGMLEVLYACADSDQMTSRIGLVKEIRFGANRGQTREQAVMVLRALGVAEAAGCDDLAEAVAEEDGHLRSVKKHVLLAQRLATGGNVAMPVAWEMAHTMVLNEGTRERAKAKG